MYKDSKINKSPIESILQQSFGDESALSKEKEGESKMFEQSKHNNKDEIKFVKESNNINLQQQLKIMQLISLTQLQIAIQTFTNIIKNKVQNCYSAAMSKIKRADLNKNAINIINKNDIVLAAKKIYLFYQKLSSVMNTKKLKNIGSCFTQIQIFSLKAPMIQKTSSNVSPFRDYSKIQNSDRVESDWQLAHSQGGPETYEQLARQNRFLKKKKEKMKACREDFCNKIDQMLSAHEAFLSRK